MQAGNGENSMKKIVWCGVLLAAAVGCSSSSSTDPNVEAWTREVRVIAPQQIGDREYEEVASLEEKVTITTMGEEHAVATAKENLRRRAAKLDADAVVIIACGQNVRSPDTNSMRSMGPEVVCQGVAIRWKSN
jgi:Tfp pilus assembly protein PilP